MPKRALLEKEFLGDDGVSGGGRAAYRLVPGKFLTPSQIFKSIFLKNGVDGDVAASPNALGLPPLSLNVKSIIQGQINWVFHRRPGSIQQARFNNADFACLYASFEHSTAAAEVFHSYAYGGPKREEPIPADWAIFEICFVGWVYDLTKCGDAEVAGLLLADYAYCQQVAQIARFEVHALISQSVREDGRNLNVFAVDSVSPGEFIERFAIDPIHLEDPKRMYEVRCVHLP